MTRRAVAAAIPEGLDVAPYDRAAWAAEIERKREANARRRALTTAAYDSQRPNQAPKKSKPKAAAEPKARPERKPTATRADGRISDRVAGDSNAAHRFDRAQIYEWYRQGKTREEVAALLGVTQREFKAWARLYRVTKYEASTGELMRTPRRLESYTREEVLAVYNDEYAKEGGSLKDLTIARDSAAALFAREGLPLRPHGKRGEIPRVEGA